MKKLTENECLEEVLRLVKIFCFTKLDPTEIPQIRQLISTALLGYLKILDDKRKAAEDRILARQAKKYTKALKSNKE